ncbi:hypothetical protein [Lactococcus lactis]|uniref:hypothetical protein n=1 Tax=Lactococcus lactis TaxID=1358 RepID=UPI0033927AEF
MLKFIVLLLLSFILIYVVAPSTIEELKGEKATFNKLVRLCKNSLPYIFTLKTKIILILFLFFISYILNLKDFEIDSYFTVSLTCLSLLLTTSNISRNLFTQNEISQLKKSTWENYLGRFLVVAIIWAIINLMSLFLPLIPVLYNSNFIKIFFLEFLVLGIIVLFNLLTTTIILYTKKDKE